MNLKKHGTILLNGFIVVAPLLVTVYVVVTALLGLDRLVRAALKPLWFGPLERLSEQIHWEGPLPGIGIVVGVAAIYVIGLVARSWFFGSLMRLGEKIVDRIPLVKSVYAAVRDLLQFLGGTKEERGRPAIFTSKDGAVQLLGLVTQEQPEKFLPGAEGRVAVYLPMSYQIGGFTVFVDRDAVQEIKGLTVEDLLKLSLTAGIGTAKADASEASPAPAGPEHGKNAGTDA